MSRRALGTVLGVAIVVIAIIGGVVFLSSTESKALPGAETALVSDEDVSVELDPWITMTPAEQADTGFIFYPGARVQPAAYAPPARAIAEAGYLTVVVPMPLGLAVFGADKATEVMDAHPEIEHWVLGGHSLGGAMAAQYADDDTGRLDGLALWGAYPSADDDISESDLLVASIYASEDGLSSVEEIEETARYLPASTEFVLIEGGNHTNFGLYERQAADGEATITAEEQQAQTVTATLDLLDAVDAAG